MNKQLQKFEIKEIFNFRSTTKYFQILIRKELNDRVQVFGLGNHFGHLTSQFLEQIFVSRVQNIWSPGSGV